MKLQLATLVRAAALAATLTACGGGTDGTGATQPTQPVTSSGVMTRGSVILNGTHFASDGARVTDDRGRTSAQLASGMVIRLRGRSDDDVTGIADLIEVQPAARGAIASINRTADPVQFTLAGAMIVVDEQTLFAGLPGAAALAPGVRVEAHGLRDSAGL